MLVLGAGCSLTFDSSLGEFPNTDSGVPADAADGGEGGDAADADGTTGDTGAPDAALDAAADSEVDATDATDDRTPVVTVTAPDASDVQIGTEIEVTWTVTPGDLALTGAVIELVDNGPCSADADARVAEVQTVSAGVRTLMWEIPLSVRQDTYRIRVRVEAESGAEGVACSDVFTATEPAVCAPLDCGAANRACDATGDTPVCGVCLIGFEAAGSECVPVECGAAPEAPPNAVLGSVSSTRFGGQVTYGCLPGYTTSGAAGGTTEVARTCTADATWSEPDATCRPLECGAVPVAGRNARFTAVDRTTVGGAASYICDEGFAVISAGLPGYALVCGTDGVWAAQPTCERVDCGALTSPTRGSVATPGGTLAGAVATYSCEDGFVLTGVTSRTCGLNNQWSDVAPTCVPVDCGPPPVVANGTPSGRDTAFEAVQTYACAAGYVLSGAAQIRCAPSGNWSPPPQCNDVNECLERDAYCTGFSNTCRNLPGTWECGCDAESVGSAVSAGNASCALVLGSACESTDDCPDGSWCSDVPSQRRCAPLAMQGTATEMRFAFVPAGTSLQGARPSDPAAGDDELSWSATVSRAYFVSRTEVTQGQWTAAPGAGNPSQFTPGRLGACASDVLSECPAEGLRWIGALGYANWLSREEGLTPCYVLTPASCDNAIDDWSFGGGACTGVSFVGLDCDGYRLLTESEWERAARAGSTAVYPWGDDPAVAVALGSAWYNTNAGGRTHQVGQLQPNAWGLYDMIGNVDEWVWDRYDATYPSPAATDYLGADMGDTRVIRGGSFQSPLERLRVAVRSSGGDLVASNGLGFRLARTVPARP